MTRTELLARGKDLTEVFCRANKLQMPEIRVCPPTEPWRFDACAYYRPTYIAICVERCAPIGRGGRAWSYPGHYIDRTPYGVLQHELGHHADYTLSKNKGRYFGDFSVSMRRNTGEKPLTGYCPNDAEWFAEIFRLFVTNPLLLRALRPRSWEVLYAAFKPVEVDSWQEVLKDAPARTIAIVQKKIQEAAALASAGPEAAKGLRFSPKRSRLRESKPRP